MNNISKLALVVALLVAAAVAVNAGVRNESALTSSGGVSLTSNKYSAPPTGVDVATDGDGTIVFYWFDDDAYPYSRSAPAVTSSTFNLRAAYPPRHFEWAVNAGPDSAQVTLVTAAEVIVTW